VPTARVDGVNLYYEEEGAGLPLVFVHEFAGDYRSWHPQVRFFSRRYRAIAFNARGYPPSDVPESADAYSQDRAAEDIRGVLDALVPGQVTVGRAPTAIMLMSDPSSRLLDALGIRWIYTDKPLPISKAYVLRFEGIAYNIYERLNTVPRAFFVGRYQRLGDVPTQRALQAAALNQPSAPDLRREVLLPGGGSAPAQGPPSYAPAEVTSDRDSTLDLQVRAPRFAFQEWSGVLRGLKNIAVESILSSASFMFSAARMLL